MKYPSHATLPSWHVWSDGRAFLPGETKRFRKMWLGGCFFRWWLRRNTCAPEERSK